MAKSSKKPGVLAAFTVPMKVEIREPEFEPLTSLDALDLARLSKGNHKIEIGFVRGGYCRNLVRAVIKNGMVMGCEVEPCKDSGKPIPRKMLDLFARARKEIKAGRKWQPIPVGDLVKSREKMLNLIIIGGGCILICIWGWCIMCCWYPRPHCFFPDIDTGPLRAF
jgi:hypothetical protein